MGRWFLALPVTYLPTAPPGGNKSNLLSVQRGLRELETVADAFQPWGLLVPFKIPGKYFRTPGNLMGCLSTHPGATGSWEKTAARLMDWSWSSGRDGGGQVSPLGMESTPAGQSSLWQPQEHAEIWPTICSTLSWWGFACWPGEGEAGEGEVTQPQASFLTFKWFYVLVYFWLRWVFVAARAFL